MEEEIEHIIQFRRELHKHPEVSCNEFQTQRRIINKLKELGIESFEIGGTGVMVRFDGAEAGKTIMLRADTDALPITEINTFAHKSIFEGVSHKCGHDGHTAIMVGVALHLLKNPPQKGTVLLLFQPAEENGEGAKAVLKDPKFDLEPDVVYAFHNLPGYPLHKIVVKDGSFTTAVKSIIIKLNGKTSHAAEPELGINPARCISEIISFFEKITEPNINSDDFALATPVYIHMGEMSYGVSAGYGEVHYTLRTWNNQVMDRFTQKSQMAIAEIAQKYEIKVDISWAEEFFANQNDPKTVSNIKSVANEQGFALEERATPFKWGEDFGLFTEKYKGAMYGIGSGVNAPALHNPDYDFPDEIIPTGIKMFTGLIYKTIHE